MTSATAPTLPGRAPEFPPAAPQGTAQTMREIFAVDDFLKNVANDHELENQKKLAAAYDSAVRALVGPNDVQVEMVWSKADKKEVEREFKKKSAWKKLARYFRIDVTEVSHRVFFIDGDEFDMRDDPRRELVAEVKMRGIAPWGQLVETLGACTTYEKRFGKDMSKAWHDCLATAQTRASNRAISDLIAAGEVSAEEIAAETKGDEKESAPARREPASKKEKPARDKLMPMGHNRGTKLGDIDNTDLESAAKWCRENNKYPDLVSAIADVLAERIKDQGKLDLEQKAPANPQPAAGDAAPSASPAAVAGSSAAEKPLPENRARWSAAQLQSHLLALLKRHPELALEEPMPQTIEAINGAGLTHGNLVQNVVLLESMIAKSAKAPKQQSVVEGDADDDDLPF